MSDSGHRRGLVRIGLLLAVICVAACSRAKPTRSAPPLPPAMSGDVDRVAQGIASPAAGPATLEPESGAEHTTAPAGSDVHTPALTPAKPPARQQTDPTVEQPVRATQPERAPVPVDEPLPQGDITHTVRVGDTLSAIAQTYGVSSWSIMTRNGVWDPNTIFVGQRLLIPLDSGPTATPFTGTLEHVVVKGDTIAQLARTYRTTPREIRALNASTITDPDHLVEGMVLTIHVGTAPPVQTHTVRFGESLSLIAQRYGVTTQSLIQTNGLRDPNSVRAGQLLIIPAP